MGRLRWLGILIVVLGLSGGMRPAAAQTLGPVIYDSGAFQPLPDFGNLSDPSTATIQGARFTLAANATLGGVRWWGTHGSETPEVNNFAVGIFEAVGGSPGPLLHSITLGSLVSREAHGESQYRYEAELSSIPLAAGTYVISITNDTGDSPNWFWSGKNTGSGGRAVFKSGAGPWVAVPSTDPAFQLTGVAREASAVPEPRATLLFLPALAALGILRLRRRPRP